MVELRKKNKEIINIGNEEIGKKLISLGWEKDEYDSYKYRKSYIDYLVNLYDYDDRTRLDFETRCDYEIDLKIKKITSEYSSYNNSVAEYSDYEGTLTDALENTLFDENEEPEFEEILGDYNYELVKIKNDLHNNLGEDYYKGDYFIKYDSNYYYGIDENNAKVLIRMYEENGITGEYDLYDTMVKITTGENIENNVIGGKLVQLGWKKYGCGCDYKVQFYLAYNTGKDFSKFAKNEVIDLWSFVEYKINLEEKTATYTINYDIKEYNVDFNTVLEKALNDELLTPIDSPEFDTIISIDYGYAEGAHLSLEQLKSDYSCCIANCKNGGYFIHDNNNYDTDVYYPVTNENAKKLIEMDDDYDITEANVYNTMLGFVNYMNKGLM